jgi:hypothetical protein
MPNVVNKLRLVLGAHSLLFKTSCTREAFWIAAEATTCEYFFELVRSETRLCLREEYGFHDVPIYVDEALLVVYSALGEALEQAKGPAHLVLSDVMNSDNTIPFVSCLRRIRKLEKLHISDIHIITPHFTTGLDEALSANERLIELMIDGSGSILPCGSCFRTNCMLVTFEVSGLTITDEEEGFQVFVDSLRGNPTLRNQELCDCNLTDKHAVALASIFDTSKSSLCYIEKLDLGDYGENNCGEDATMEFARVLCSTWNESAKI